MRQVVSVDLFGHNIQGQPKEELNWKVGVVELSMVMDNIQKYFCVFISDGSGSAYTLISLEAQKSCLLKYLYQLLWRLFVLPLGGKVLRREISGLWFLPTLELVRLQPRCLFTRVVQALGRLNYARSQSIIIIIINISNNYWWWLVLWTCSSWMNYRGFKEALEILNMMVYVCTNVHFSAERGHNFHRFSKGCGILKQWRNTAWVSYWHACSCLESQIRVDCCCFSDHQTRLFGYWQQPTLVQCSHSLSRYCAWDGQTPS